MYNISSAVSAVVVDFKGYTYSKRNRFFCKNFVVLKINSNEYKTGIFKQPFPFSLLSNMCKKSIQIQEKQNVNNLSWTSGDILYSKRKEVFQDIINHFKTVRVYV